jgi:hypothetical protein
MVPPWPPTYLHPRVEAKRKPPEPSGVRTKRKGDRKMTGLLTVLMWWLVISFFTGLIAGRVLRRLGELG